MHLCSFPPLLIAALIFCLFLQLSCMLRPLYPCLRPLQILPFVTALCNLTLLNFIIKHMAGSEAHHYTFFKNGIQYSFGHSLKSNLSLINYKHSTRRKHKMRWTEEKVVENETKNMRGKERSRLLTKFQYTMTHYSTSVCLAVWHIFMPQQLPSAV